MVRTKCPYTIGDYAEVDQIMGDLILVKLNLPYPPFARVVFYLRKFNLHILG